MVQLHVSEGVVFFFVFFWCKECFLPNAYSHTPNGSSILRLYCCMPVGVKTATQTRSSCSNIYSHRPFSSYMTTGQLPNVLVPNVQQLRSAKDDALRIFGRRQREAHKGQAGF